MPPRTGKSMVETDPTGGLLKLTKVASIFRRSRSAMTIRFDEINSRRIILKSRS